MTTDYHDGFPFFLPRVTTSSPPVPLPAPVSATPMPASGQGAGHLGDLPDP